MEKLEPTVIKLRSYLVAELRRQPMVFTPPILFSLLQLLAENFSVSIKDQSKRNLVYIYQECIDRLRKLI